MNVLFWISLSDGRCNYISDWFRLCKIYIKCLNNLQLYEAVIIYFIQFCTWPVSSSEITSYIVYWVIWKRLFITTFQQLEHLILILIALFAERILNLFGMQNNAAQWSNIPICNVPILGANKSECNRMCSANETIMLQAYWKR